MAKHIHIYVHGTRDADGPAHAPAGSSKGGQFVSGSGGGGGSSSKASPSKGKTAAPSKASGGGASSPNKMDKASLKEGQALYSKSGQKIDAVESVAKRSMGGYTVHTRSGLEIHVNPDGSNAQGITNTAGPAAKALGAKSDVGARTGGAEKKEGPAHAKELRKLAEAKEVAQDPKASKERNDADLATYRKLKANYESKYGKVDLKALPTPVKLEPFGKSK